MVPDVNIQRCEGFLTLVPMNTHNTYNRLLKLFQSCDLEGKASTELQHKRVNISQTQIFISLLKRMKTKVFLNTMQVLAICDAY